MYLVPIPGLEPGLAHAKWCLRPSPIPIRINGQVRQLC